MTGWPPLHPGEPVHPDGSDPVKLTVEATALEPSGRGNLSRRLVFAGAPWKTLNLCIHGQQLKWHCAECEKYFKDREKPKQKKR